MADIKQFEDDVIRWLLSHYDLLNTRTRWMLLDIEEQLFTYYDAAHLMIGDRHPRPRMLSFRAFHEFFPAFPVRLNSAELTLDSCDRLKFPKPFASFEKTRLYRDFREAGQVDGHGAIAYRWSYQREVSETAVLHNCLPLATTNPGYHCCWRLENGNVVVMQSLCSFVDSVELLLPTKSWKTSAVDPHFDEVVESTSSTA